MEDAGTDSEPACQPQSDSVMSPCLKPTPIHTYQDYANAPPPTSPGTADPISLDAKPRGGVATPFPSMLHTLLERAERDHYSHIVSWKPHGRAFQVHDKDRFVKEILPMYSRQTQFASFQRQLNLYGFRRLSRRGPDYGAFYSELFLRAKPDLAVLMTRTKVNGNEVRQGSSPRTEPNFYAMPPVGVPVVSQPTPNSQFRPAAIGSAAQQYGQQHQFQQVHRGPVMELAVGYTMDIPPSMNGFPSGVPPPSLCVPFASQGRGESQNHEKAVKDVYNQLFPEEYMRTLGFGGSDGPKAQAPSAAPDGQSVLDNAGRVTSLTSRSNERSSSTLDEDIRTTSLELSDVTDMARFLQDVDLDNSSDSIKRLSDEVDHIKSSEESAIKMFGSSDESRLHSSDESLKPQGIAQA